VENSQTQTSTKFSRLIEHFGMQVLGWIPRPIGTQLRQRLYRPLFGHFGRSVYIQAGSEFLNAKAIEIGDDVKILRDVRLNANAPNSAIRLGNEVSFDRGVDINVTHFGNCQIEIGEFTHLGPYTCIAGPGPIKIGRGCMIASHSSLYSNNHVFSDPEQTIMAQGIVCKGIVIEDDCWLGTGVRVLDGVTIGKGCVIGAGAVVTKDIPPYSVAVGVPAKVISQRKKQPERNQFNGSDELVESMHSISKTLQDIA
jgi:acetyltransferase-like isoleucine patch superfamily enzyme